MISTDDSLLEAANTFPCEEEYVSEKSPAKNRLGY